MRDDWPAARMTAPKRRIGSDITPRLGLGEKLRHHRKRESRRVFHALDEARGAADASKLLLAQAMRQQDFPPLHVRPFASHGCKEEGLLIQEVEKKRNFEVVIVEGQEHAGPRVRL